MAVHLSVVDRRSPRHTTLFSTYPKSSRFEQTTAVPPHSCSSPSALIGAGFAVEDQCQGWRLRHRRRRRARGAPLMVISARRQDARREEDGLATGAGASAGVRYGGWLGWRLVRGNGGAGSGPRRCAVALEAAGQAAPPVTARLPATSAAYSAVLPDRSTHPLHCPRPPHELVRAGRPGAP
jgi:hypothetical protein